MIDRGCGDDNVSGTEAADMIAARLQALVAARTGPGVGSRYRLTRHGSALPRSASLAGEGATGLHPSRARFRRARRSQA